MRESNESCWPGVGVKQNRPMLDLLNLLAAIALLVCGSSSVRPGVLRVFGADLRELIAVSVRSIADPILQLAGALAQTRYREPQL